jgi:hypothetical protein
MFGLAVIVSLVAFDDKDEKLDAAQMATLRKKVAGKVTIDRKSGVVQIAYDFRTAKQGNDFLVKEKPSETKNGLSLKASAVAEHVVPWRTVAVEAQTQISKFGGVVIQAPSQKANLQLAGANYDAVYLGIGNESESAIIPAAQRTGLRTLRFEITEDSALAAHSTFQVSKPVKLIPAGKIEFHGGNYGNAFRAILFRGKVDPDWLKPSTEK